MPIENGYLASHTGRQTFRVAAARAELAAVQALLAAGESATLAAADALTGGRAETERVRAEAAKELRSVKAKAAADRRKAKAEAEAHASEQLPITEAPAARLWVPRDDLEAEYALPSAPVSPAPYAG